MVARSRAIQGSTGPNPLATPTGLDPLPIKPIALEVGNEFYSPKTKCKGPFSDSVQAQVKARTLGLLVVVSRD